jgi:transposase
MQATTIGFDIAKSVFQIHGEDASGKKVLTKRLKRGATEEFFASLPPTVIGIEACGSSHHWGRLLSAMGHEVRLIPPGYVKPFVKRNKTDARDAEAICEAIRRPSMKFVPVKTVDQQSGRALENARGMLVRQRTQLMNAIRGMLAEVGIIAAKGQLGFNELRDRVDDADPSVPASLLPALRPLLEQWRSAGEAAEGIETQIVARAKKDPAMRLLTSIPGIGAVSAHAICIAIGDGKRFSCGRDFAAWIGLTPLVYASGGRTRVGNISAKGDSGLRRLLVLGASTVVRYAKTRAAKTEQDQWLHGVLARRPVKVATVARAAKNARVAWAVLTSGTPYQAKPLALGGAA